MEQEDRNKQCDMKTKVYGIKLSCAKYLDRVFNGLSLKHRKMVFLILGLATSGICIWTILATGNFSPRFSMDRANTPKDIRTDRTDKPISGDISSDPEILRIQLFRQYLDSLQQSEKGRAKWDSILLFRPGLMDSIDIILNNSQ